VRHHYVYSTSALVAVVGIVWLASVPAAGQVPTAATKATWDPPRTPDGQPDIQGYWANLRPLEGNLPFFGYSITGEGIEAHDLVASGRVRRYANMVVGGKLPYQPWALAKREEYLANHNTPKKLEYVDTRLRCFLTGPPRLLLDSGSAEPPQIFQMPGYVLMLYEWNHGYQIIPLDGSPHVEADIKLYQGDSRGRWEGNTLVIDVTNMKPGWFDNSGNFFGSSLHVVERWTLVDRDTLHYEATVEDPTVFTSPWRVAVFTMTRRKEPGYEQLEAPCHEGNHTIEHVFPGSWVSTVPR